MFNYIPNYIFHSKLIHHFELPFHGLWRFNLLRFSIGRKLQPITRESLSRQLVQLLGSIDSDLFSNNIENELIIKSAGAALRHEFDILGSGNVRLNPMHWNRDLKTGFVWKDDLFYRKQRKQKGAKGSDIKQPWELSRCHHLLWLSEAYLITRKEEYAKAVISDIENWIDNNKIFYSVNWLCSMEVAIRAINWLYALNMISESTSFSDAFATKVNRSLYQHGYFIYHHLEKSFPYSNNHYVSDIVGLLFLGKLFYKQSRGKWYDFSLKEFCLETRLQVLPSGVHYEKSVSYHRLMTELLCYSYYFLLRNGELVPEDIKCRIHSMIEYIVYYNKPNGMAPLVGDNDNGRLLPFVKRDFRVHDYLYKESLEMRIIANGLPLSPHPMATKTKHFEDAGIAILRSSDSYLFITGSEYDKYSEHNRTNVSGSHLHNDLLSFELSVLGYDVFVDAGSYVYTSDLKMRNEFRSTKKHNTAFIDKEEQNFLFPESAFITERNAQMRVFNIKSTPDKEECRGSYILKKSGAIHNRLFTLSEGSLRIDDEIIKSGNNHEVVLSFHLAKGNEPRIEDGLVIWENESSRFSMRITPQECIIDLSNDNVSPSYGVLKPSKTINISSCFDEKVLISTIIEWKRIIM